MTGIQLSIVYRQNHGRHSRSVKLRNGMHVTMIKVYSPMYVHIYSCLGRKRQFDFFKINYQKGFLGLSRALGINKRLLTFFLDLFISVTQPSISDIV